jgi:Tfp pilus assembly protein PilN
MRAINLLPQQAAAERRTGLAAKLPFVGSAAVPVIALVLVFVGYTSAHSGVASKQSQLATLNAELAASTPATAAAAAPSTAGLVAERSARLSALQTALANEVPWDTALLDLARVIPPNVWLTSLTALSPTPADKPLPAPVAPTTSTGSSSTTTTTTPAPTPATPSGAPTGFTIQGATYTQADVGTLLARLQLLPDLTNVTLVSTTQQQAGTKVLVEFDITASLQSTTTGTTPGTTP